MVLSNCEGCNSCFYDAINHTEQLLDKLYFIVQEINDYIWTEWLLRRGIKPYSENEETVSIIGGSCVSG